MGLDELYREPSLPGHDGGHAAAPERPPRRRRAPRPRGRGLAARRALGPRSRPLSPDRADAVRHGRPL